MTEKDLFIGCGARQKGFGVEFKLFLPMLKPKSISVVGTFNNWGKNIFRQLKLKNKRPHIWKGSLPFLSKGYHEYKYVIELYGGRIYHSSDPNAKFSGKTLEGNNSAFHLRNNHDDYSWKHDSAFVRPTISELIAYEIMISDFVNSHPNKKYASPLETIKQNLFYIKKMGFNCIEFMPFLDCAGTDYNWGYNALHFFAVDPRHGTSNEIKALIDECHKNGISVIMDIPLNHTDPEFGYFTLYDSDTEKSPFIGKFGPEFPGLPDINYSNKWVQQFAYEVCKWWTTEYHVDGFRFDFVSGYYDEKREEGIPTLIHEIRKFSEQHYKDTPPLKNLPYLCLEYIGEKNPLEVLNKTEANSCWYDNFRGLMHYMAEHKHVAPDIQRILDPCSVGLKREVNGIKKTVFNQLENHDHHSFIVKLGCTPDKVDIHNYPEGDREKAYKSKPYIIALYTGCGAPMIHNGQEFGDNWYMPEQGADRVIPRSLHWEFSEDEIGKQLIALYTKMNHLKSTSACLSTQNYYHWFTDTNKKLIAFHRCCNVDRVNVVINFSDTEQTVNMPFPENGVWVEYQNSKKVQVKDLTLTCTIPAYDGLIFTKITS